MVKLQRDEIEIIQVRVRQVAAETGADLETVQAIITEMVEEEQAAKDLPA